MIAILAAAGLSGCGTISGTSASASPDAILAGDVRDRLASDPDTGKYVISVSVTDGVVTLDGHVPSDSVRLRAKGIASGTHGVKGIIDNLGSN